MRSGRHQWHAGTELIIEEQGEAVVLRQAKPFARTDVEAGIGCTGYRAPAKHIEEMDAGIDAALRRDWGSGDDP